MPTPEDRIESALAEWLGQPPAKAGVRSAANLYLSEDGLCSQDAEQLEMLLALRADERSTVPDLMEAACPEHVPVLDQAKEMLETDVANMPLYCPSEVVAEPGKEAQTAVVCAKLGEY